MAEMKSIGLKAEVYNRLRDYKFRNKLDSFGEAIEHLLDKTERDL